NPSVWCKGTRGRPRRVAGASITSSPIAAEPAGRVDGDAEQLMIDGPLEPDDAGVGQLDLQLRGAGIEDRDRQAGGRRGTARPGQGPGRRPLRDEGDGWRCLAEAAFPGVERHRADAESAAELGDRKASILLALDLAAPPFAPRLTACWRSESGAA